jgi:hypothetical protein
MPTAFEREQARQAALAANTARFTGRPTPTTVPPPAPAPIPQPVQTFRFDGARFWDTTINPINWSDGVQVVELAPPPPPNKTVTFEGMELEIPHWTGFVTQNKDGTITAFEHQPFYREDLGYHAIGTFPRHKVIMKPEEYPERIENV